MGHAAQKDFPDEAPTLGAHDDQRDVPILQGFQDGRQGMARVIDGLYSGQASLSEALLPLVQPVPGCGLGLLPVARWICFMNRHIEGVQQRHLAYSLGA